MGATTLYHPVPLSVIRGAAEYCGWKFGKIVQNKSVESEMWARYDAEIFVMPPEVALASYEAQQELLQSCFMRDIKVSWLHKTRNGKLVVWIITMVPRDEPEIDIIQEHRIASDDQLPYTLQD